MLRLKYTAKTGNVYLGPFVYDLDEKQAKRKLKKMDWLVPKNSLGEPIGEAHLELIEVDRYPEEAIFDWRMETFDTHQALAQYIKLVDKKWRKLDANYKEDFDEMENGCT